MLESDNYDVKYMNEFHALSPAIIKPSENSKTDLENKSQLCSKFSVQFF